MRQHTRNAVGFVVLAILMAALFYWNINTGSVHLSLERMLTLLRWGNDGTTEGNILWKIRLSRLLGSRPFSKTPSPAPLCWASPPAPACLWASSSWRPPPL